jgi:hypothetical protein
MNNEQLWWIAISFAIIIVITLLAQFKWLPSNRIASAMLVFPAGVGTVAALYAADIPPDWFDGSRTGFMLGATLALSSFLGRDARECRLPFLLGMGGALLVFNVLAHV